MLRACLYIPLALGLMSTLAAAPTEECESSLSDAACRFTVELLKAAAAANGEGENVVTSPVSIGAVLAMLQQGAKGSTAEQLEKVLHLSPEKSREGFSTLATFLKGDQRNVTLEWANGIYLREDFTLDEEYKNVIKENFRSVIESMNFTDPSTEETANNINKWISEVTHEQINDLVQPSMINSDTVMILVNAIYFRGIWASKFKQSRTRVDDFHMDGDKVTRAAYMRHEGRFPAGEDSTLGVKWVELPYEDDKFAMLLVLPKENGGMQKLMETMSSEDLKRMIANTETKRVNMGIPKFKLKWKSSLVQLMTKMGLADMFTSSANLEGITSSNESLTVSEMVHQANLEVDEDGTVASGATVQFVQVLSLVVYPDEMIFYADHPFLAFIVDKNNKIPLFAAKIGDPTSGVPAVIPLQGILPD